jgi:hypothetical protein
MVKRLKNLTPRITDRGNIEEAMRSVISGKKRNYKSSKKLLDDSDQYIDAIREQLLSGTYTPGAYHEFKIMERGKERVIQSLPIYDRIVLRAIMNILGNQEFKKSFISDTYASIKGRGIMSGINKLREFLDDREGTKYCLKIDIKKFYNSVDQRVLIDMLRRHIKDEILIKNLENIIGSFESGLPIGYHSSQYLGNFYLSEFDHYIKSVEKVKYYIRYCDDIVVLSGSKEYLHQLLQKFRNYLEGRLHLTIKDNYQIFPVESRGIDFLGYVSYHDKCRLRKSIKKRMFRTLSNKSLTVDKLARSMSSFNGWITNLDRIKKVSLINYIMTGDSLIYNFLNSKYNRGMSDVKNNAINSNNSTNENSINNSINNDANNTNESINTSNNIQSNGEGLINSLGDNYSDQFENISECEGYKESRNHDSMGRLGGDLTKIREVFEVPLLLVKCYLEAKSNGEKDAVLLFYKLEEINDPKMHKDARLHRVVTGAYRIIAFVERSKLDPENDTLEKDIDFYVEKNGTKKAFKCKIIELPGRRGGHSIYDIVKLD